MSEVEQNKALIDRFMEAAWQGQSGTEEFYTSDAATHLLNSPSDVPDMAQTAAYLRAAMPDLSLHITMTFGQEDRVMQHYTVTGTHTGAPLFNFPPSGRALTIAGENIFRITGAKIVERWSILDVANAFQQLSAQ